MQVGHPAYEVDLEGHKQQEGALNAQPTWELKQQGLIEDVWELYPIQVLSFVLTEAFSLALDNLVERLHLGLLVS